MPDALNVVIVEDEQDLREAVVEYLTEMGMDVRGVADGRAMRAALAERPAAVVVLDIALPGEDGLSLCRWVRRETTAGVIMATAAGRPLDRVVGLEIGADDYVVKPYELRELLARIRAIARRVERTAPAAAPPPAPAPEPEAPAGGLLALGAFRLDTRLRRLLDPAGADVHLTPMEYDLALYFAERPGRIVSRSELAENVQRKAFDPDDRSIDISVTRLRKKIEQNPSAPQIIRTVRGEGYRLDADAK